MNTDKHGRGTTKHEFHESSPILDTRADDPAYEGKGKIKWGKIMRGIGNTGFEISSFASIGLHSLSYPC